MIFSTAGINKEKTYCFFRIIISNIEVPIKFNTACSKAIRATNKTYDMKKR